MKIYSTKEAARMSGASLRQIQWWDERGILKPIANSGMKRGGQDKGRQYTAEQVRSMAIIVKVRSRGFSIRHTLMVVKAMKDKGWRYLVAYWTWLLQMRTTKDMVAILKENIGARLVWERGDERTTEKPKNV